MPHVSDREKMDAVKSQLKLFTSYLARLQREGNLSREQDETGMKICIALEAVIEDYKVKVGA